MRTDLTYHSLVLITEGVFEVIDVVEARDLTDLRSIYELNSPRVEARNDAPRMYDEFDVTARLN